MLPLLQNYKSSPWCVINKFFYLKSKQCFVLKISSFLCFCERFENLWRHHKHWYIMEVTFMLIYFSWIQSTIKIRFCQILVCCMANISNIFLPQCWRLETSSKPFYYYIKMTILWDLAIFNSSHLLFLNIYYSHFETSETLESWYNLLQNNWSRLLN